MQEVILCQLTLKNVDFEKKLYLITDASKVSNCGILLQKSDGNFYPIEFFLQNIDNCWEKNTY